MRDKEVLTGMLVTAGRTRSPLKSFWTFIDFQQSSLVDFENSVLSSDLQPAKPFLFFSNINSEELLRNDWCQELMLAITVEKGETIFTAL